MNNIRIILDGDGATTDLAEKGYKYIHLGNNAAPIRFSYLSGGMASGKPSCAIIIVLEDDKSYVIAEISAALFVAAARAIKGKALNEGFDLG